MQRFARIRPRIPACFGSAAALTLALLIAQSGNSQALPPSAATHPAPAQTAIPVQPTPPGPATPAKQPADRARVAIVDGQLAITAENSSLDQILGDIARLNGMKITGGVTDERVFGSYGPGSQQEVIAQLLDGTGSNVLILENPDRGVSELVLTPRNGGPTPPSPSIARPGERESSDLPPDPGRRRGGRPEFPDGRQFGIQGMPQGAQPLNPNGLPNPEAGTTTQQSPNGVKTPQQIYDDLVKAQQAAHNPQ
jgi:hypothetical protein